MNFFFYCKQRNICFQSSVILLCFFSGWNSLLDYRYFETIYLKKIVPQSAFCLSSTQIIEQAIERILRGKIKAYCRRRSVSNSGPCWVRTWGWGSMERPAMLLWHFTGLGTPTQLLLGHNCFPPLSSVTSFQKSRGFLCRAGPTHQQPQPPACAWIQCMEESRHVRTLLFQSLGNRRGKTWWSHVHLYITFL